jgi:hypothetical protein
MYTTQTHRRQTMNDASNPTAVPQSLLTRPNESSQITETPYVDARVSKLSECPYRRRDKLKGSVVLVRRQRKAVFVQSLEGFLAIGSEIGLANGRKRAGKEARLPLAVLALAFGRLCALLLFNVLLQGGGERVLLVDDGVGDTIPELAGFVRELVLEGWDVLRNRKEWIQVDKEELFLCACQ